MGVDPKPSFASKLVGALQIGFQAPPDPPTQTHQISISLRGSENSPFEKLHSSSICYLPTLTLGLAFVNH